MPNPVLRRVPRAEMTPRLQQEYDETLKLRELDYVQAATAFGVSDLRIMSRHIVPNVMHLVLITLVLFMNLVAIIIRYRFRKKKKW